MTNKEQIIRILDTVSENDARHILDYAKCIKSPPPIGKPVAPTQKEIAAMKRCISSAEKVKAKTAA